LLFEMESNLLVEAGLDAVTPDERSKPAKLLDEPWHCRLPPALPVRLRSQPDAGELRRDPP